jgi:hypothetical protein
METGCFLWEGQLSDRGYGVRKVGGKDCKVHRLMWQKYRGEIEEILSKVVYGK